MKTLNVENLKLNFAGGNIFDEEFKEKVNFSSILSSLSHMTKLKRLTLRGLYPTEINDKALISYDDDLPLSLQFFKFDYSFKMQDNLDHFLLKLCSINRRNIQLVNYSL